MEWQCPSCGTVLKGPKKSVSQAKKAKCPGHTLKVVRVSKS